MSACSTASFQVREFEIIGGNDQSFQRIGSSFRGTALAVIVPSAVVAHFFFAGGPAITSWQAGLSCERLRFRQATMRSSLGMSNRQRRKTSGVHVACSSAVPLWSAAMLEWPMSAAVAMNRPQWSA